MTAAHITGLPRSGTCWLSMVINAHSKPHGPYQSIEAYHELVRQVGSAQEFKATLYNPYVPLVVDCSSVIVPKPEDKLVVIQRDPEHVKYALSQLQIFKDLEVGFLNSVVERSQDRIDTLLQAYTTNPYYDRNLLEVYYPDLYRTDTVSDILAHLGIIPEPHIIEYFLGMNIQAQYMRTQTLEEFLAMGTKTAALIKEIANEHLN